MAILRGAAACPIYPTRGVVPGCPGACTWAKLALLEAVGGVVSDSQSLGALRLQIHVDDITVATSSESGRTLVSGMLQVRGRLQGAIEDEVSGIIAPA